MSEIKEPVAPATNGSPAGTVDGLKPAESSTPCATAVLEAQPDGLIGPDVDSAPPEPGALTLDMAERVLQEMLQSVRLNGEKLQENPGDHARLINACARLVDSATRLAVARGAANPAALVGSGGGPTPQQLQQIQLSLNLL